MRKLMLSELELVSGGAGEEHQQNCYDITAAADCDVFASHIPAEGPPGPDDSVLPYPDPTFPTGTFFPEQDSGEEPEDSGFGHP